MIERRKGTYASVKYNKWSCDLLEMLIKHWKIPNPIKSEHFHSTLIYSRVQIPKDKQHNIDSTELQDWQFELNSLALFSDDRGVNNVLVLKLNASRLVDLHITLINSGATHDFETFEPHITLSYDVPTSFDWKNILVPHFNIVPAQITFEPLDVNWGKDD
jgi:hypothetical protein